jgi:hypothetical protein
MDILANHYGKLSRVVEVFEARMDVDVDKLLAQPDQNLEAYHKLNFPALWIQLVLDFNLHPERFRRALEKVGHSISISDDIVDALAPACVLPVRPRGDTTTAAASSAELMGWVAKAGCALVSDDTTEIDQLCDTIPTWEEYLVISLAGYVACHLKRFESSVLDGCLLVSQAYSYNMLDVCVCCVSAFLFRMYLSALARVFVCHSSSPRCSRKLGGSTRR